MEPLLELADRITAHLWFFYQCCPQVDDLESLSRMRVRLEQSVAQDYAKLQAVLDLADLSLAGNGNPTDPLPQFRLPGERPEQASLWHPFRVRHLQEELLRDRRERAPEIRAIAAERAFAVLEMRNEKLRAAGLRSYLELFSETDVFERSTSSAAIDKIQEADTVKGRSGDKPSAQFDLTSDALFERIASWLGQSDFEPTLRGSLAEAFLPLKDDGKDEDEPLIAGDWLGQLTRTLKKPLMNVGRMKRSREVLTRFLMEANLDGRAKAIVERGVKRWPSGFEVEAERELILRSRALLWLKKNEEVRLQLLLDRESLRMQCRELEVPVPFSMALSDELDEILRSRDRRLFANPNDACNPIRTAANPTVSPLAEAHGIGREDTGGEEFGSVADAASRNKITSGLATERAFQECLFGLALSGGGIRSATFALGLLQGMADRNVLPYIDIISSVSGGGYLASWLVSWTKRRGSIQSVQDSLRGFASPIKCPGKKTGDLFTFVSRNQDPKGDHLRPVRLLREYSRYLAPQDGIFSADSWTIGSTWLRNTLLNLTILTLLFGGVLLLPRMVIFVLFHSQVLSERLSFDGKSPVSFFVRVMIVIFCAGTPFLWTCWVIGSKNLKYFGTYTQRNNQVSSGSRGLDDGEVVVQIVLPLLVAGLVQLAAIWNFATSDHGNATASGFVVVSLLGLGILHHHSLGANSEAPTVRNPGLDIAILLGSGAISYLLMLGFCSIISKFGMDTQRGLWMAGTFGPALLMVVVGITIVALLGLSGTSLSEEQREWWSRLGAWLAMATLGWVGLCLICFYMPLWISIAGVKIAAAGVAWGAVTAAGVKLAFSASSGGPTGSKGLSRWQTLILDLAPAVFVVGHLSLMSFVVFWGNNLVIDGLMSFPSGLRSLFSFLPPLVDDRAAHQLCCTKLPMTLDRIMAYYWPLMHGESISSLLLAGLLLLLCWTLARRVDINEFSMHHFYRNRLVRAYLGATRDRAHRQPNAFTGFDLEDDIRLQRFTVDDPTQIRDMVTDCKQSYVGPFPIVNTALNITKGQDLGIQARRAESFSFSPIWSGFDYSRKQTKVKVTALSEFGYRRTEEFGKGRKGASLGTAMAISGAAFNSNAGFHTSPALAFLLTVFGVRLGWWAGNPRWDRWESDSPPQGLGYLVNELTAKTSTEKEYVLLTDGGHFENMGMYELIRRRCRYIVVSDAEEDEEFKLEGIGGAVRKCRNDFGVVIKLNLTALKPLGDPQRSKLHYSIGTIRYPGEKTCGTIVYIKASLTDDEDVDLIEFGKRHSEFPHTSTVNQFFDEAHFESYRELGHHVASGIFKHDMPETPLPAGTSACAVIGQMFVKLESDWRDALKRATAAAVHKAKVRIVGAEPT